MSEKTNNVTFDDHKVVKRVLLELSKAYKKKGQNPKKFEYCRTVQGAIANVYHTLKTLQLIRVLVAEEHPIVKKRAGSAIERNQFLRYNIENYFLRITTYKDQILSLIVIMLQWGIGEGLGLEKKVKKKSEAEGIPEVMIVLTRIETMLSSVRHIRNRIAHRGVYDNLDLSTVEIASFADNWLDQSILTPQEYDAFHSKMIFDNIREMMQIEEEMTTDLYFVLRKFYKYYLEQLRTLS